MPERKPTEVKRVIIFTHNMYESKHYRNKDVSELYLNELNKIVDRIEDDKHAEVLINPAYWMAKPRRTQSEDRKNAKALKSIFKRIPQNRKHKNEEYFKGKLFEKVLNKMILNNRKFSPEVEVEFHGDWINSCSKQHMAYVVRELIQHGVKIKSITPLGGEPSNTKTELKKVVMFPENADREVDNKRVQEDVQSLHENIKDWLQTEKRLHGLDLDIDKILKYPQHPLKKADAEKS